MGTLTILWHWACCKGSSQAAFSLPEVVRQERVDIADVIVKKKEMGGGR